MNLKAIVAIIGVLIVALFGWNYYSSKKSAEKIAAIQAESKKTQAETEKMRLQNEKADQIRAVNERISGQQSNIEKMPKEAQEILKSKIQLNGYQDLSVVNKQAEQQDRDKLESLMKQWSDASSLANRTARISLSPAVKSLQDIREKVDSLKVTPCLTQAQANLLAGMNAEIQGFYKFMEDSKAETEVQKATIKTYEAFGQYYTFTKQCTS